MSGMIQNQDCPLNFSGLSPLGSGENNQHLLFGALSLGVILLYNDKEPVQK
jgi:hypothetical protein